MELRQLEYFVAVAEECSFTKAAARVHVAQPGVSAQIRRLEQELGETLFDRSGRVVRLTDVGAAFLPYARSALSSVDGARLAVDELAGLVRGRVAVGMVTSCGVLELPDALARFHREHSGVEISLREDNSDRLLEGVQSGRLDLAFVGIAGEPPAGIAVQYAIDDRLFAAVEPGDALAGRDSLTLAQLAELPLVSLPRGTGLRSALDEACDRAGLTPRIAFEASNLMMVAALAARELGVAILPESVATADASQLHPSAVTDPEIRSQLALAWRTDGPISPAARELIAIAREALGGAPADARAARA
jgi:DNA-binding transcriptional LysR family regulator